MTLIKRFGFFILTNLMVMVTIGIVWSLISLFVLPSMSNHMGVLLLMSAVMGMTGAFVSLLMSRWMAKSMHGVSVISENTTNPEEQWLLKTVHQMARQAQLPKMPEVGIYNSPDVNAFATGPTKSRALVAVSSGLLQKMSKDEVAGVVGHEVAHIANGDMVTMTLIQGVVNTFAFFFSRLLASVVANSVEERNRHMVQWIVTMIGDIAFTLLGSIVVASFSRHREFRADIGGATFSSRQNMLSALQRLQAVYESPYSAENVERDGTSQTSALKISTRSRGGFRSLFMTHPPLEVRIEALKNAQLSSPQTSQW